MHTRHTSTWASALCLLAAFWLPGCVDDAGTDGGEEDAQPDRGLSTDATADGTEVDEGLEGDEGLEPDEGPEPDMGPRPDRSMQPPPPDEVATCQQACTRYGVCDRLEEVFGDEDACLDRCERVSRTGPPQNFFDCLEIEECNLVHLCRMPEVQPLTCAELCAQGETCEVELPFADCEADCENGGEAFQACGERLLDCNLEGFLGCLAEDVYPGCQTMCTRAVDCNILAPETCLTDCIDGLFHADALARLRQTQRNACVGRNEECVAIDECVHPPEFGGGEAPTLAAFCALYNQCNFEFGFSCEEIWGDLEFNGPNARACGINLLRQGCPADEFEILNQCDQGGGADPVVIACGGLCEAQSVCETLPEGQNRIACNQECVTSFEEGGDFAERLGNGLRCATAPTCDALAECLDSSDPRHECEAHCAALGECGEVAEDCVDACDLVWARDRHAAYRTCVAAAGACEALAECKVAREVPCLEACTRVAECAGAEVGDCVPQCDDSHFATPLPVAGAVACILTAPVCAAGDRGAHSVQNCAERVQYGGECLGYCRAVSSECTEDSERDLGECLSACGAGFVGGDGLRFAAAEACLQGLEGDADCDALSGCVPAAAEPDCEGYCGAAAACDIERADCAANCAEDPLSQLAGVGAGACLAEAGEDCEAITQCIDPVLQPRVEPPPVDRVQFCVAYVACGLDQGFDGVECQRAIEVVGDEAGVRCMADIIDVACPPDANALVQNCQGGGGGPHPYAGECRRLCRAQAFCAEEDFDQLACQGECQGRINVLDLDSPRRETPLLACASAFTCGELADCLENSSPEGICAIHCGALDACGAAPEGCVESCDEGFARSRQFAWRDCVERAGEDCEAVAACAPEEGPPCEIVCRRQAECGLVADVELCTRICDDAAFEEPLQGALSAACTLAARECQGEGVSVAACLDDPAEGGGACLGYCRSITECDEENEDDLLECMNRCVNGFGDANGLRYAAGADCFDDVAPDGDCAPLLACLPEAIEPDCEAHCGFLEDCGIMPEECVDGCAAAADADVQGCVVDALRVDARCQGVADCVDFEREAAGEVCEGLCSLQLDCDSDLDTFLCEVACTPEPEVLPVQLACAQYGLCGDVADCLALEAGLDEDCDEPCVTAVECGLFPDAAACANTCTGQAQHPQALDTYAADLGECLDDAAEGEDCDAEAAGECFLPALCELTDEIIRIGGVGGVVPVNTALRQDFYQGSCGGAGPEQVIAINVRNPSTLTAEVQNPSPGYDSLIFMRSSCDDGNAEVECDDDGGVGLSSRISVQANPGTYFLFIDGFGGDSGQAEVRITIAPR